MSNIRLKLEDLVIDSVHTYNIGDTVQTLAAINMLKKAGIYEYTIIDCEELNKYDGEEVYALMNGWFLHNLENFPPSPKIKPIFVSFHCQYEKLVTDHVEYFKKHQLIGCRDMNTVKIFHKYGIEAYFTGCLTLTFGPYPEKGDEVIVVDVNTAYGYVPKIDLDKETGGKYTYIEHDVKDKSITTNFRKRIEYASSLLDKYRRAKYIITPRLHCTLPSRVFRTRVKFIHKNIDKYIRFGGLRNILLAFMDKMS